MEIDINRLEIATDNQHIQQELQAGRAVVRECAGKSMTGEIEKGELMLIQPLTEEMQIAVGDIVACKIDNPNTRKQDTGPRYYYHNVAAIEDGLYTIANNAGYVNGVTTRDNIYGMVIAVLN